MSEIIRIGLDTSKSVFQLHGVDAAERPVLKLKLSRSKMLAFFAQQPPCLVALEACGASHHWARTLAGLGHTVRLIAPQHVKPYVPGSKTDAADAAGLCEAVSRPQMRFVPVKTAEQQAALMLTGLREQWLKRRTQVSNSLRGYAAEFGLAAPQGLARLAELVARLAEDPRVPALARPLFAALWAEYQEIEARVQEADRQLKVWQRGNASCRRLSAVPGIGPVGAALLVLKTPAPQAFRSGRDFAAWLGLTPKDHATAGKPRLGGITRAGDEQLRSVLVAGAMAVLRQLKPESAGLAGWLTRLVARKARRLVAVALANKLARIAWRLLVSGASYDPARAGPPMGGAEPARA
ncbi:IS110-like element ISMno16 family transposase [Methylobacterium nodulans]|uniref:Transposase IS116/IS110/IS902 family protein n=1 Tax=Methylobacterium nodulans (strain LMG 21967 / CNCM I-2342 / ORS 2060) TaxID=460265 RepID=B8I9H4_METNO|nr:IS110-like element ISMno16 family transposase [Methylobacterium nodulans]ACL55227.1 transposase IS116/IS110/IS902 family protein [Methylobacterium nodulans ORS 2060]ACL55515.1 transposase IS116/IS110/IS902 family protein [Methylobacterium nodulans ORS 2060]ACL60843.1 transposase IS116/IS110/IS902 family protein [Methylobacterium nodulans ORS 2060]ACL61650.1 transposase IS116/IS110/IS902 family protein [Methylobacterium nodulans ORS 2060]